MICPLGKYDFWVHTTPVIINGVLRKFWFGIGKVYPNKCSVKSSKKGKNICNPV